MLGIRMLGLSVAGCGRITGIVLDGDDVVGLVGKGKKEEKIVGQEFGLLGHVCWQGSMLEWMNQLLYPILNSTPNSSHS